MILKRRKKKKKNSKTNLYIDFKLELNAMKIQKNFAFVIWKWINKCETYLSMTDSYLSIIYSLFCAHEWRKIKRIRSPTRRFVTHRWNFCSSKKINVNQPTQLQLPVSNDFSPRSWFNALFFPLSFFFFHGIEKNISRNIIQYYRS